MSEEYEMPSVRLFATISVIIGIIVVVGVVFSISSRLGFPAGNNEKPNTTIHQVFLNNSTHIDTPYVKEFSMPNGTCPNGILAKKWNSLDSWNNVSYPDWF